MAFDTGEKFFDVEREVTIKMTKALEAYLEIALIAVQTASRLVKKIQRETILNTINKEDNSPVTIADFSSQAVISHILQTSLGLCTLVGEENSHEIQQSDQAETLEIITNFINELYPGTSSMEICKWIDYGNASPQRKFWTVDPVDGTKGFLRGDQYVVALAYLEDGIVKIGVLGCPNLDMNCQPDFTGEGIMVYAVRGQGAWNTPMHDFQKPIRISTSTVHENAKMRLLRSFESSHTNTGHTQQFLNILGVSEPSIAMDSQAKYAVMAGGHGEIMLRMLSSSNPEYKEKIWDQAAGSIILEEAGGKITDLTGHALDFTCGRLLLNNTGVLATNGLVHDEALQALKQINRK